MSREIKFRAWDKTFKKMLTELEVMRFDSSESGIEQVYGYNPSKETMSDARWVALKEVIVMQYTGLKDKNGKEIYEGDIVKEMNGYFRKYQVKFDDYRFTLWEDYWKARDFKDAKNMEIIGNIYENPELIKNSLKEA